VQEKKKRKNAPAFDKALQEKKKKDRVITRKAKGGGGKEGKRQKKVLSPAVRTEKGRVGETITRQRN